MTKKMTNQRPPEIITRFARQLSHILADYLVNPQLGDKRHPLKDRIAIKLMMTLSETKLYREELLFRDYSKSADDIWIAFPMLNGKTQKLHIESIFYVSTIFTKRLQLIAKHKSLPTNLHMLLLMLCRYSQEQQWLKTRVRRSTFAAADINDAFFNPVAKILKRLCQSIKSPSPLAYTYKERYGALYLTVGQNRAEIPAEISWFDMLEVVPRPLNPAIQTLPVWYPALVERIMLALNEGYGFTAFLRLITGRVFDEISIGKLRELKNLRKASEVFMAANPQLSRSSAYLKAFNDLLHKGNASPAEPSDGDKKGKVAGFVDFNDFSGSKVGAALLQTPFVSLDKEDDDCSNYEPTADCTTEEIDQALREFLTEHVDHFSPLTHYFFEHAYIDQRPLQGKKSLLKDPVFLKLVASDSAFADLDEDKLRSKLCQKMEALLSKLKFEDWLDE